MQRLKVSGTVWHIYMLTKVWNVTVSFIMFVSLPSWKNSAPTGQIFVKFVNWVDFENLSRKFKFQYHLKGTDTLLQTFVSLWLLGHSVLLRLRNVSDKHCREIKPHASFLPFFWKLCCLWDNVEKYCAAGQATDDKMWGLQFACWIAKATNTH
jgi:hypothetical protein